jgi:transposase
LPTTQAGLSSLLGKMPSSRVALEVGTHSPWVSRHIASLGHEVIVANPHKVKLITQSVRKSDRIDARQLARLARVDPKLLSPICHRGEQAQADLAVIRARAELVEVRTGLINCARGMAKPMGERLHKCDADQVNEGLAESLSASVRTAIGPLLKGVEAISEQVGVCDEKIEAIARRYPEMELLTQVYGVGTLIALTFILTIEDAERFAHSRDVGPFLGLQPKQRDSGESQPQLGISKTGDQLLRCLLVQGAHCILRKGAPDSDLRAWVWASWPVGARTPSGARWWRWRGNWRCCCTNCGPMERFTIRCTTAKRQPRLRRRRKRQPKEKESWNLLVMRKRRVGVTARSRQIVGSQATGCWQIATEMAAPLELRTPMGTAATAAIRVRMEVWRLWR